MFELNTETGVKLDSNRLMRLVYYLFPLAIILAVIFTFLWMFEVGKIGYALRGVFTGIPAILSCLFVLFIYKKNVSLNDINVFPSLNMRSLSYLYGIFYIGSLVSILLSQGNRPWYYFAFILVLYLTMFLQIFSEKVNPSVVLLETFLIMINLIYSVTLNYDFYFGTTDILSHVYISEITAITGQTISPLLSDYAYFPLYHILIAAASELMNTGVKTSLFVITAPIYAVTVIFLYYLFNYMTNNRQISLLSSVLFSVSSIVLYYGVNVITRTMAFIAFVLLLYLIYSVNFKKDKISLKILSVIIAIFLTLVHNVSLPQIVLLLIILFVSEYIIGSGSYFSKPFFLFLNVTFVGYWFFVAYLFVQRGLSPRLQSQLWESLILTAGGAQAVQENLTSLMGLLDRSIFLFFALIGIGFLLKYYKNNYASVIGLFSFLTLIFYVPNPLNTIWQLNVLFRFDRFILLVSPFMAFAMGYGIYIFWNYVSKYSLKKLNSFLLIVLLFSGFVFVSSIFSVGDSSLLGQDAKHEYFTSDELSSFAHVLNYAPANSAIYTDYYTSRFFYLPLIPKTSAAMNLAPYQNYRIGDVNNIPQYRGYTVLRTREFLRSGLYFGSEESTLKETPNYLFQGSPENKLELENKLANISKIYSNPATDIFIPRKGLNSQQGIKPVNSLNIRYQE
jgi:hypothetical protein